jgi:hypothetical protein
MVPEAERGDLIARLHRRLFGPDPAEQTRFARAWAGWESSLAVLDPGEGRGYPSSAYALAFARLENHYFIMAAFSTRTAGSCATWTGSPHPGLDRAGPLRHDLPAAHRPRRAPGLAGLAAAHGDAGGPRAVRARHHGRARRDHGRAPGRGVSGGAPGLERFVRAQDRVWPAAEAELRAGAKRSHWMWFVFPQIAGLGRSETARFYAIADLEEARAYARPSGAGAAAGGGGAADARSSAGRRRRRSWAGSMRSSCARR